MEDALYWLWLTNIEGIGEVKITHLLEDFGSISNIYFTSANDLYKLPYLHKRDIINLQNKDLNKANQILKDCKNQNIEILIYNDTDYPKKLLNLDYFPYLLYTRGCNLDLNKIPMISVIGSRSFSEYGSKMAVKFSSELAQLGIVIVSGMARGIDSIAHKSAIRANGYTIAVLGSGIDIAYPAENRNLQKEIEKSGLVISEYPPSESPSRENFPRRNRIISGLSDGLLVVECRKKSGTSITVNHALRQGIDVYTLPTNINNSYGEGNLSLLKNGAIMVTETLDIVSEYMKNKYGNILNQEINLNNENITYADYTDREVKSKNTESIKLLKKQNQKAKAQDLSQNEQLVYDLIWESQNGIGLEDIIESIGMNISEINTIVSILQLKDLIKELPFKKYEIFV